MHRESIKLAIEIGKLRDTHSDSTSYTLSKAVSGFQMWGVWHIKLKYTDDIKIQTTTFNTRFFCFCE